MELTESQRESLKPYMPRLVINWLAEEPQSTFRRLDGTLIFVDISGFTKLSERLAKQGKIGAEELTQVIGSCFARLLAVAYGNGGGLIKFGGDALLIFFSGSDHEDRACRSAIGMRAALREIGRLETAGGRVNLRMSVGVHSGTFDFFLVGDSHRELIVTGPAATQTVLMEQTAEAGEIVVSAATAAALPSSTVGAEKGPGVLLRRQPHGLARDLTDTQAEQVEVPLEACVPVAVLEHLLGGGGGPEHRQVTVTFLHFDGTDALMGWEGPQAVADTLQQLVSDVQHVVDQHEIAFLGTDIDKDGGKIILTAGAPKSSGNDEERMLRTVRQIIEAHHIPIRFGVNRGYVFAGDIGPPFRRTYTVMGDAVNLAARLMAKAAPGQVLASLDVLERSRSEFGTKEMEPFFVKGKAQPIRAALVGPVAGTRHVESAELGPLFGRIQELRALFTALASAKQGIGAFVELVGEPGIGKSRLIEELKARGGDVRTYSLVCDQYESSTPYFPFRFLLRAALGISADDADAGGKLGELVEHVAPDLHPWLPLIAIPMGVDVPSSFEVEQLEEQFRRARLNEVVADLLGRVVTDPAVVIFEDVHWMDEASNDLLAALLRDVHERPWMICATRRDQGTGFVPPTSEGFTSIHLRPLSAEESASLAWAGAEEVALAPHEIEILAERSGGNPLFLQELVRAAQAAGSLEALPESVDALIMARIDTLAPADRTRLRQAAVLGMAFHEDLLKAILPSEVVAGDGEHWERLADFLHRDVGGLFRFRHGLIREVAYEGLPYGRRRELHARAAETIEGSAARPDDEAEILSLHFLQAGQLGKAWRYSQVAAERAQAIYANSEAQDFYQRALNASRGAKVEIREVAAVWEALGDVRSRMGAYDAAVSGYREARRRLEDPVSQARLMLKIGEMTGWLARRSQALAWIKRGLKALEGVEGLDAERERADLMAWYGRFRQEQGKHKESIEWCLRAIEAGEASGARKVVGVACETLGWDYMDLGQPEQAAAYSERALGIYEELGDLGRKGSVLNNLGAMAYWEGRWNDALGLYERAKEAWEKTGDSVGVAAGLLNIGEVLSDQGYVEDAEPLFEEALRIGRAAGYRQQVAVIKEHLGRVAYRSGRFDQAMALLQAAREESHDVGGEVYTLEVDARIAECLVFMGEAGKALEQVNEALRQAAKFEGVPHIAMLHRIRGYALMQVGEFDSARAAFKESLEEARSRDYLADVALTLNAMQRLSLLMNEPVSPEVEEESQTLIERLGMVASPNIPLPASIRAGSLVAASG